MRYWYPFIYLSLFGLLASGCIKSNCENTFCANDGVCVQGNCSCVAGYEGDDCTLLWADKFAGNWQASEAYDKDTSYHSYTFSIATIAKDSFLITGFADTIDSIHCIRTSRLGFKIIETSIQDSTFVITEGAATLDDSSHTVTGLYSFRLNDSIITTKFTWKQ